MTKINGSDTVAELVDLSNWLGAPERDCAILGEGNTSARISETSFMVKASGTELGTLDSGGLVEIDFARIGLMLDDLDLDDEGGRQALIESKRDPQESRMPSVETPLHAVCLMEEGVSFVGHTHPTAINAITCSAQYESALRDRIFPDEVVVCGPEPLLIPYVDPGIHLARVVREQLSEFRNRTGRYPKTIYLQNHGFIALGTSAKQVKAITAMAVKSARTRLGTMAFGGPHPMPQEQVDRIDGRLDEHYRQAVIDH